MEFHDPSRIPAGLTPSAMGILPQVNGLPFPVGYTPDLIQTAYGIDNIKFGSVTGDGTGQTIAIVDAYDDPQFLNSTDPNFTNSDLAQFDAQLGICPIRPASPRSTSPAAVEPAAGHGSERGRQSQRQLGIEEALDIEWAHAMAPGANIVLVEATTVIANADLFTAVTTAADLPGVSVVSMSWGLNEYSGEQSLDSTFVTPSGHQGVTFLAASGDSGGFAVDAQGNPTTTPGILYPAASPNVVAVGGTTPPAQCRRHAITAKPRGRVAAAEPASTNRSRPTSKESSRPAIRTIPDVSFEADPQHGRGGLRLVQRHRQ